MVRKVKLSEVVEAIILEMADDQGPPDFRELPPAEREAVVDKLRQEHGAEIRALVSKPGLIHFLAQDDLDKPAHRVGFHR
jgi:hypothetical protein